MWSGWSSPAAASRSMLAGLTSRCTRPRSCAASRAAATWVTMWARAGQRQRVVLLQERKHVAAGHQAHRDEQDAVRLAGIEDGHDVRMVDRGRDPRLPDEPAAERLVAGERGGQDLQRAAPAEALVEGAVDDGHAPSGEDLVEAVPGEMVADGEFAGDRRLVAHRTSAQPPALAPAPSRLPDNVRHDGSPPVTPSHPAAASAPPAPGRPCGGAAAGPKSA